MIFLLHVEWPEMPPYKLLHTKFDARLNGIFCVALKAISWVSGVDLNYTKKVKKGKR